MRFAIGLSLFALIGCSGESKESPANPPSDASVEETDTTTPIEKIKTPSEGSKVTRAEYDKIVAEKQAEMMKQRRGRRN